MIFSIAVIANDLKDISDHFFLASCTLDSILFWYSVSGNRTNLSIVILSLASLSLIFFFILYLLWGILEGIYFVNWGTEILTTVILYVIFWIHYLLISARVFHITRFLPLGYCKSKLILPKILVLTLTQLVVVSRLFETIFYWPNSLIYCFIYDQSLS